MSLAFLFWSKAVNSLVVKGSPSRWSFIHTAKKEKIILVSFKKPVSESTCSIYSSKSCIYSLSFLTCIVCLIVSFKEYPYKLAIDLGSVPQQGKIVKKKKNWQSLYFLVWNLFLFWFLLLLCFGFDFRNFQELFAFRVGRIVLSD